MKIPRKTDQVPSKKYLLPFTSDTEPQPLALVEPGGQPQLTHPQLHAGLSGAWVHVFTQSPLQIFRYVYIHVLCVNYVCEVYRKPTISALCQGTADFPCMLDFFCKIKICIFTSFLNYILCMGVCLHVSLCTTCVPNAFEGQKRALDP